VDVRHRRRHGGRLTNAATGFITLNGAGNEVLSGTLNNTGTITQTTPGNRFNRLNFNSGAVLNNTGLYDLQENFNALNGSGAFNNSGTLRKSAGGASTDNGSLPFSNTGTVEVDTGTLALNNVAQVSGSTLADGTWLVFSGASLVLNGGVGLTASNASIILDGVNPLFPNITNLATNGGIFQLLDGASFTTTGNFTNTGTLTIGLASVFTVTGDYTQTSTGTLDIQLGDVPASGQFGTLAVTGTANLDGTLQIDLVNGYTPNFGDSFTILTFASRNGDFATLNIPASGVWDPNAGTVTF
jgi:hypothetical protein